MESKQCVSMKYDVYEPQNGYDASLSPIIMLHGMTSARKTWKDIPQKLADTTKRKVYAPDARNHGESEWTDVFHYAAMAYDVDYFMNEHNIHSAIIIGHSMGGKTAMMFASEKGEKVEELIVEDMTPKRLPDAKKRYPFFYLKLMRQSVEIVPQNTDLKTAKKLIVQFINSQMPSEHATDSDRDDGSTLALKITPEGKVEWQTNLDGLEAAFTCPEMTKEINGIYNGPALFVYGTKSPYGVGEDKDYILERFPQAEFKPVEGAKHTIHTEYPDEFFQIVSDFILKKS